MREKATDEKLQLVKEKTDSQRHVTTLQSQVAKVSSDEVVLENQLEAEEERQLEKVVHKNRALEKRLEKGKYLSESETSLFHEHYASFTGLSSTTPSSSRPSSRDVSRPSSRSSLSRWSE